MPALPGPRPGRAGGVEGTSVMGGGEGQKVILGSKSPGGARNERLLGRSGIDLPWELERTTKEVVWEKGLMGPLSPQEEKWRRGKACAKYE